MKNDQKSGFEEYGTGKATALKSGGSLQLVIPSHIVDQLQIKDRDVLYLSIKVARDEDGKVIQKQKKRTDLKKHLRMFKKTEPQEAAPLSVEEPQESPNA